MSAPYLAASSRNGSVPMRTIGANTVLLWYDQSAGSEPSSLEDELLLGSRPSDRDQVLLLLLSSVPVCPAPPLLVLLMLLVLLLLLLLLLLLVLLLVLLMLLEGMVAATPALDAMAAAADAADSRELARLVYFD